MRLINTIDDTFTAITVPIKSLANVTATTFSLVDGYVSRLNVEQQEKDLVHTKGSAIRQDLLKTEFLTQAALQKIELKKALSKEEVKDAYEELEKLFEE